jgi:long-chain acyl-CoA synthetase
MDKRVSLGAGGLSSLGIASQDRVAILMHNCPEYIFTYFSVLRAGGIAVPLNTFLTPDEIVYILIDSGSKLLVYSETFSSNVEKIKTSIPHLKAVVFEEIPQKSAQPYEGSDEDIAVLLYTSGTTGFPKGVMLTDKNLISNADASNKVMRLSPKDRILLFLPLFHAFSFTVCVILPVLSGATIVLLRSVKPFSKVLSSIVSDRISFFVAIPTIYKILSRKKMSLFLRIIFRLITKIRACVSGASALPENIISDFEKKFHLPLIEGYGLTEASPVVAVNPLYGKRKPSSVGPPIPGVEAAVIDEDGKKLPAGATGELIVRGVNVMKGYYNKREETNQVLKDEWLHTGDMARVDEDGYIFIVDRKKDLIIVDGMNIYPREVEDIIMQNQSVEECAMVGVPGDSGTEITTLFLKIKADSPLDEKDVISLLKGRIAQYKIPKRIVFLEDFPKTATSKIKKTELRKWKL